MRPLLALGPGSEVEKSLRKKSNKSRINRLKNIAPLKLVQIKTRDELERVIDTIADFCDLRQGAIHSSLPFRADPKKKEFWLRLAETPGAVHGVLLMLGDKIIAAHIGPIYRTTVSLGIIVHSPFYAQHSPGKLLILMLARELSREGFTHLDLTPGGDEYKARSADRWDEVQIATFHFNVLKYVRGVFVKTVRLAASSVLEGVGQGLIGELRKRVSGRLSASLLNMIRGNLRNVYRRRRVIYFAISPQEVGQVSSELTLRVNCISDLLLYKPSERSDRTPAQFFSDACQRLESGDRVYTLADDHDLLHYAWAAYPLDIHRIRLDADLRFPANSCLLWDDYTHPKARGLHKIFFEHCLRDAATIPGIQVIFVAVKDGTDQAKEMAAGFTWSCSALDTAGERARIFNPPVAGETGRPMIGCGGERPM
jgi:hypothetical protein